MDTEGNFGCSYKLSDEVDENGRQFVLASDGSIAFGKITPDTGLTAAPIYLSEGLIINPKTKEGYGLLHIEARHGDEIRDAGYDSVILFVEAVAKNYEVIKEGKIRDGNQTYMLQLKDEHNNTLMIELSGDGTLWNINTAGVFKTSYGANKKEVYNRHTTVKQSAETAEESLGEELGGTTSPTRMNTPTTSVCKVIKRS